MVTRVSLTTKCPCEAIWRAARLVGRGLYGVDLKQTATDVFVMEVNDNPNIDGGVEDLVLKDKLYTTIMDVFLRRIEARKHRQSRAS